MKYGSEIFLTTGYGKVITPKYQTVLDFFQETVFYIMRMGYQTDCAFLEVLKEINTRAGAYDPNQGKFVKKLTGKEYKADFSRCK